MATPDVRVRLSAEGLQEVLDALRKVQAESGKTKQAVASAPGDARKSFLGLNSVLASTRNLLGVVGLTATTVGFVRYIRSAGDAALQTGLLAESLGSTVSKLTALQVAAGQLNIPLEQIEIKVGQFADQLSRLIAGEPKAVETFRKLGLSAADFPTQDTVENFETVLKALGRLEDGYEKVTLASNVFGRAGTKDAALLPLGNLLAQETAAEKAFRERVGEFIQPQVVPSTQKVTAELSLLNRVTQSLAQNFISGLAPAASRALRSMSEAMVAESDTSVKAVERIGESLGRLFLLFTAIPTFVLSFINLMGDSFETMGRVAAQAITGNFALAGQTANEEFDRIGRDMKAAVERFRRDIGAVFGDSVIPTQQELSRDEIEKFVREYVQALELLEIEIQGSVRRQRLLLQTQSEELRDSYERGLIDLQTYHEKRLEIAERQSQLEVDAIRRQIAALEAAPDALKNAEEIAKLYAKLDQAILFSKAQRAADEAKIDREHLQALEQLAQANLKAIAEVAEAQGRAHENRRRQIREEQRLREQQLFQEKRDPIEAESQAAEEAEIKLKALRIEELQTDAARQQLALEIEIGRISQEAAEGKISEAEAARRILEIEARRLPVIRQVLEAARAIAEELGNTDLILRIEEMLLRLDEGATQVQSEWQQVGDMIRQNLVGTLAEAGHELTNLHELWLSFRDAVLRGLQQFAAQKLVQSIADAIPGFSDGGPVRRFASGGPIEGPGTDTSDSILIYASRGEYVVRAAAVKKPGVLPMLERINQGQTIRYTGHDAAPPSPIPPVRAADIDAHFFRGGKIPAYASGGLVADDVAPVSAASPASATVNGEIVVVLDEGLILKAMESRAGQKVQIRTVQKNARLMRGILNR